MLHEYNVLYHAIMIDHLGKEHQEHFPNKKTALVWARKHKAKQLIIKTRSGQIIVEYKRGKKTA